MYGLKNDRYLRALLHQSVDITPVWMMRQAGRHLPEYKIIRDQVGDFITLYRDADLACEITLQPLQRYSLDAAILFSDILTIPDAMGLGLIFDKTKGPQFSNPIRSKHDIEKLSIPDPEQDLIYVMNAIRSIRYHLKNSVPLIGFSGSPWTLATYMLEGENSKIFTKVKKMLYTDPKILHLLLNKLTDSIILYLNGQICAGAQAIILFDTWGGILTNNDYNEFSLYYMHKIIDNILHEQNGYRIPITIFTKGCGQWLNDITTTGCDAIGLDWSINIGMARNLVGHKVVLQGNMDPAVLYGSTSRIEHEVITILNSFGLGDGHIFSLGHGLYHDVLPKHVKYFVEAVHRLSGSYHHK